jgi:ankyrin repeat protein
MAFIDIDIDDNHIPAIETFFHTLGRQDYDAALTVIADNGTQRWYTGWNALGCAVWQDAPLWVIERLLSDDPSSARNTDNQQRTALHMAIAKGRPTDIILAILAAWPAAAAVEDEDGTPPAFTWIRTSVELPIFTALHAANPLAISVRDAWGALLLHYAALSTPAICAAVLAANPAAAMVTDSKGWLPIHYFCRSANGLFSGSMETLTILYDAFPAGISSVTRRGEDTPLHFAVMNPLLTSEIVAFLLCANPKGARSIGTAEGASGLPFRPIDVARAHYSFVGELS